MFIVVLVLLFALANMLFYKFVAPSSLLARTDSQFYPEKYNTKILLIGDSHIKSGLDPLIINSSFNLASLGENYIQTYYKLRKNLQDEKFRPEFIVMPLDLHTFSSYRSSRFEDHWYWKDFVDFREVAEINKNVSSVEKNLNLMFPLAGQGRNLIKYFFQRNSTVLIKGYMPVNESFLLANNKEAIASARADYHLKNQAAIDSSILLYFSKLIELAQEKGIKVILVKFPITKEYYNAAGKYIQDNNEYYSQIFSSIKSCRDVYLMDYQKKFFGKQFIFKDSDHLNYDGAEQLSRLFTNDMKALNGHKLPC